MLELFLDIETIPSQRPEVFERIAEGVAPPGSMTKAETIERWEAEKKPALVDEAWRRTALDGLLGEVISIAFAVGDGPVEVCYRTLENSEAGLLDAASGAIAGAVARPPGRGEAPCWIGHNLAAFDLRFLWQRHVINRVRPHLAIPHDDPPWSAKVADTLVMWRGARGSGQGSMTALCDALGYKGKGDIDGSSVWDYVVMGREDEVADYCIDDVERTRLLYRAMTFADTDQRAQIDEELGFDG